MQVSIYHGTHEVRTPNTIYPQAMSRIYPEVFIIGLHRNYWSSEFMRLVEKPSKREAFWKLQGDILGTMIR
jgi:hypothetical protein